MNINPTKGDNRRKVATKAINKRCLHFSSYVHDNHSNIKNLSKSQFEEKIISAVSSLFESGLKKTPLNIYFCNNYSVKTIVLIKR